MSPRRERPRLLLAACITVVATFAYAAVAGAFVDIYRNDFSGKREYREIKTVSGGKSCVRAYKESRSLFEITVKDSARTCNFKPPVQGVNSSPDHRLDAAGRLKRETPGVIRKDAFLTLSVRVGGGSRYEFRVFPKERDFQLRRRPDGGSFPVKGGSGAIKGMGKKNKLALVVEGGRVRAIANGTEVADVNDPSPADINGRRLEFGIGNTKDTKKDTVGNFETLSVGVPNP